MKGVTTEELYKFLLILIAIGTIVVGYLAIPEIVWVTQRNTTQLICPVILSNELDSYIKLENGGEIPTSFSVTFTSDEIKFIDDYGDIIDTLDIWYRMNPDKQEMFKFKPIFSGKVNKTHIQITAKCVFCKVLESNRCCYYNSAANNLELVKGINGKCK
ncbi:MAG: hypothetical protein KAT28_02525 [Candidatus Aenigmarchaeota archaeon]|nr:hypothetical protein [Candidatus Aenigmarchaeota archaeon]